MHDVHPYSMYRFLQLIIITIAGSPDTHPRSKEKQGEGEKKIQAKTLKQKNTSITFRAGFGEKRVSQTHKFLTTFLKKCNLKFEEGPPSTNYIKLPNLTIKAVSVLTNV